MASYQVVCSVIRPPPPTQRCQIPDFQEKVQQHIGSVFHDAHMEKNSSESVEPQGQEEAVGERERRDPVPRKGENQILCALISKAKASFSGEDNFQWKLPCFWCNFCPFGTESRPSLLQHLTSQHCFRCHHCPYVALTRSAVAQHSLQRHPEFEKRAREQKLKECHLLRDIFQERFAPSTLPEAPGKDAVGSAAQHSGSQDDFGDAVSAFDAGFDSSSDSSDAPSLSGHRSEDHGAGHSSSAADCNSQHIAKSVSKTKSLSENIVSSSSMEVETAGDFYVYPEPGTELESKSSQGRKDTEHDHLLKSDGKERLAVTVKQEVENKEGFALALQGGQDRHNMEGEAARKHDILHQLPAAAGPCLEQREPSSAHDGAQHCVFPVGEPVRVKTEPESDDDCFRSHTWEDRGPSVKEGGSSSYGLRPTAQASPPLSSIRVENLQRQFEESVRTTNLGLHACERNVHPPPHCLRPRPRGTVQDRPERSGQICSRQSEGQHVVDNFLLDPSTTTNRSESLTLLRNLLTTCDKGEIVDKASLTDTHVHLASESSAATNKYLSGGHRVGESDLCGEGEEAGLDSGVQIKQEPESDAFFTTFESSEEPHHVTPFSENMHLSAESPAAVEDQPDVHPLSESENLMPRSSKSADPNLSLRDLLNRRPKPEASNSMTQIRTQRESSRPDQKAMNTPSRSDQQESEERIPLPAAEKLKALSHMTLRDILTMKLPLGLDSNSASASTGATNVTEISMGDGDGRGQVVWECGFCDFSAVKKQEVMAHRKQWHGEYRLHPDTANPSDASADGACESGVFSKTGHSYVSKQLLSGRGGHHGSPHHKAKRKHGDASSSQHAAPSRKRTRGRGQKYDNYDYNYQSASPLSVESGSDSEAEEDDPEDRNYVPPHYLLDKMDSSGSESESGRPKKMRSGVTRKFHHKGRRGRKVLKGVGKSVRTSSGSVLGNVENQGNGFYNLSHKYACRYCDHPPASLYSMKNHLRFACNSDQHHRLIAELTTYPYSVLYVCPSDSCFFVSISEKVYLEHVLPCQGLILDAGEKSLFEQILRNCEERSGKEGSSAFRCCLSSCGYCSSDADVFKKHLQQHVDTFHASQMVLMHTVCTAMAELSYTSDFVCYLCTEWMSSMEEASSHCEEKHDGRVRGVFHVLRTETKTEERPPGLLVSMICLQCKQQVPELDTWFCHTCPATPEDVGVSQGPHKHTEPVCYPPLDTWPWKTASVSASSDDAESRRHNQLPLVRSILLDKVGINSDQRNLSSRQEPSLVQILSTLGSCRVALPVSRQADQQESTGAVEPQCNHSGTANEMKGNKVALPSGHSQSSASAGVGPSRSPGISGEAALTVCGVCQQSVLEEQWKHHRCFLDKISKADEAEQEHPADAHLAKGKNEGYHSGRENVEADQHTPEESDCTPVKRSHRLLAKRLQSSTSRKAETLMVSHAEDGDCVSPADKRSLDSGDGSDSKKSANGRHKSSVSNQDPAASAAPTGSQCLRSLLVGLPAGDGEALGKAVKQTRGVSSLLRDRLMARSDAGSVTASLGATQSVGSKGSGSQADVSNPDSPSGAQSGMGESTDMVNWLHQQGSQMMRVLGGAMPKDDEY